MPRPGVRAVLASGLAVSVVVLAGARQQAPDQQAPPRFRVGVDVVRIDAVVTDKDGRVVGDLTTKDFEVYQDGRRQELISAQFVPVAAPPASTAPGPADVPTATAPPPAPAPSPGIRDVQRTLAIVVDDLSLSFESLPGTRRALHGFIDREIGPRDLVAIVRTGGSLGIMQSFTTDRRVLHAAVEGIRWNGFSRNGVEPYTPLNEFTTFDSRTAIDLDDFKSVETIRNAMSAVGTLGALNLVVRGARELPGRKAIVLVTEGFELYEADIGSPSTQPQPLTGLRVRAALDRLIDQTTRAGVVIYSLDARGLQTAGLQAADNLKRPRLDQTMDSTVRGASSDRQTFNRDTQEVMAYLAEQTGGFAVLNTNDLGKGLGRISDDVRDYYVLGYVPEEGTFAAAGKTARLHKLQIKVRRPGLRVKTRKEFFGISDAAESAAPLSPTQALVRAAISPFAASDITLRATALPAYAADRGLFVRALLHIDATGLSFVDGADGRRTAEVDVVGMVFDYEGNEVAHLSTGFAAAQRAGASDNGLRDGVAYTLRIPLRAAGAYQVRFAVRDRASGRIGAAGEFVNVPDAADGAFALSGIVLHEEHGVADPMTLTPTQALRVYGPGTRLTYAYEIYNPSAQVETAISLWRGSDRVFQAPPDRLARPAGTSAVMAAGGGFRLGDGLTPGAYSLQVLATTPDPKRTDRTRTAVQRIDFEVR
jgi:VWFA-related protein